MTRISSLEKSGEDEMTDEVTVPKGRPKDASVPGFESPPPHHLDTCITIGSGLGGSNSDVHTIRPPYHTFSSTTVQITLPAPLVPHTLACTSDTTLRELLKIDGELQAIKP
jgi:hypothetical protein